MAGDSMDFDGADSQDATAMDDRPVTVLVEIPVKPFDPTAYRSNQLHLRMTPRQADAARILFDGLRAKKATLENGHHVDTQQDAIRWMLEKIASEVGGD